MIPFLERLGQRVFVLDGAMGTSLQTSDLPLEAYQGLENCSEILNLTRPDTVHMVHESFLRVGCDGVETNTFGANRLALEEFGLGHQAWGLNQRAVHIALRACESYATTAQPRYVLGSMGPGTRLPSLGQVTWQALYDSYREQAEALIDAGAHALLVETCQDLLQTKAALSAALEAMEHLGMAVPLMAQITLEANGTMLVGADLPAALAVLEAFPLAAIGLNCATGPQEMAPAVAFLAAHCRRPISVLPNAGLPERVDGELHYPLGPEAFGQWLARFVEDDGVAMVGGCCGTTPAHLAETVKRVTGLATRQRSPTFEPSIASLYHATSLRQDGDLLFIGERTNANGSAAFRKKLAVEDWEGIVSMGRTQLARGSHALDVCTAFVGRDETRDMVEIVERFRTRVPAPLMVDSTDPAVLAAALERHGGKCIINSVNLEDGPERAIQIADLARRHGAAVVALLIDEEGMARTVEHKVQVAQRLYDLLTGRGVAAHDILFDPLTFSIATGNPDDRLLARWTLDALAQLAVRFPKCGLVLGISNVSYGLPAVARPILNSVFLHRARQAGLTAAIVHAGGIEPLYRIPEEHRILAEALIEGERVADQDPLQALLGLHQTRGVDENMPRHAALSTEERLVLRIIEGEREGLEADMEQALEHHPPQRIIDEMLLVGMKRVGDLFTAGQTQLPFVLQSAEVMKAAMGWLEPHMGRERPTRRGKMLLATVRGDVHDIGKNLVDILLTNNGFEVVNLGIKQPIEAILQAIEAHRPDALGMSGLLVKSTSIMRENLEILRRHGIHLPVILGGAALTRSFAEQDCAAAYGAPVAYARDAFAGLAFMEALASPAPQPGPAASQVEPLPVPKAQKVRPLPAHERFDTPIQRLEQVPLAPYVGVRLVDDIPLQSLVPWLDEDLLFKFHWGFLKKKMTSSAHRAQLDGVARPILNNLVDRVQREGLLRPQALVAYFPCHADGDHLRIYGPDNALVANILFPRQPGPGGVALPDFFLPVGGPTDVVALTAVTLGEQASQATHARLEADAYREYLFLHGLTVELTEALAETMHLRVRQELGISSEDGREKRDLLQTRYRGRRFAFGYPACPDLASQRILHRLLGAERIGIHISAEDQLVPEQSTMHLVVHHPQARYFQV